jgi:hypothetical protein
MEGGVKFMIYFKRGASYKPLETSVLYLYTEEIKSTAEKYATYYLTHFLTIKHQAL